MGNEQNDDESMKYTFEPNNSTDEFAIELKKKIEQCLTDCNQSSKKFFFKKTNMGTSGMAGNLLLC